MSSYEYKVVEAPAHGTRGKGVKGPGARFANTVELLMNRMAGEGWEYQRAETLPVEERSGLTSSQTTYRNVLVFRRRRAGDMTAYDPRLLENAAPETILLPAAPVVAPQAPAADVPASDAPRLENEPADTDAAPVGAVDASLSSVLRNRASRLFGVSKEAAASQGDVGASDMAQDTSEGKGQTDPQASAAQSPEENEYLTSLDEIFAKAEVDEVYEDDLSDAIGMDTRAQGADADQIRARAMKSLTATGGAEARAKGKSQSKSEGTSNATPAE